MSVYGCTQTKTEEHTKPQNAAENYSPSYTVPLSAILHGAFVDIQHVTLVDIQHVTLVDIQHVALVDIVHSALVSHCLSSFSPTPAVAQSGPHQASEMAWHDAWDNLPAATAHVPQQHPTILALVGAPHLSHACGTAEQMSGRGVVVLRFLVRTPRRGGTSDGPPQALPPLDWVQVLDARPCQALFWVTWRQRLMLELPLDS
jgi:hypothetical protein